MPDFPRTDAVVDTQPGHVVIWHVQTGLDDGMPRLTGAWVVPPEDRDKIAALLENRRTLATAEGAKTLASLAIQVPLLDPATALAAVEAERDALQAKYDALPQPHTFTAPTWPDLPAPLDLANPPSGDGVPPTQVALAVARWLSGLTDTWERIERERITRKYLNDGTDRRLAPLA
ncbi:hypothetical protein JOF53_002199 [Crossiella equi]|uniref:Uncharacterized protein n=1 Tax=Crossiella equi TaxID=130796 RepID=A0ABS5AAL4_9PSEU|nr:hypothetical protein [Crossiella equi]MBP2473327.1 hypothetical protein [Crossiella equi]